MGWSMACPFLEFGAVRKENIDFELHDVVLLQPKKKNAKIKHSQAKLSKARDKKTKYTWR
jgi:hypothetical protein